MKHWLEPTDVIVTPEILEIAAGNVLVAETLVRRGITDADSARQFLNPDLYTPTSPFDLPDMGKAVERIEKAIKQQEKICMS